MIYYITADGVNAPWVAAETRHLRRMGIPWRLTQLREPHTDYLGTDWARDILDETVTLYPIPPLRLLRSAVVAPLRFRSRFFAALGNALFGPRESLRARAATLFHLFVGAHWALRIQDEEVSLIHSQWAHACASVGMYAAWMLNVPFSFTGHAVDLFGAPVALEDKVKRARFIICISEFHRRFYRSMGAPDEKLHTVYCGIDTEEIPQRPPRPDRARRRVVTFGRLVEKKGIDVLIEAFAVLKERGVPVDCLVMGTGPEQTRLQEMIRARGVSDVFDLPGKLLPPEDLFDFILDGDIFVQPCVVARDGDMDGTPRTLMEAMICRRPCIATGVAGIPEIIEDGVSGLLVRERDAVDLADAIQRLIEDPELASRLAESAAERIVECFQLPECLNPLAEVFSSQLGGPEYSADDEVAARAR